MDEIFDGPHMLAEWTWNQLAHEGGVFAAWFIVVLCIAYLARKVAGVLRAREDKISDVGIATGLSRKRTLQKNRKFSVLDVMVAVAFVASLVGLVKGMANEERDGKPYETPEVIKLIPVSTNPSEDNEWKCIAHHSMKLTRRN
jgi:hypothetical protein